MLLTPEDRNWLVEQFKANRSFGGPGFKLSDLWIAGPRRATKAITFTGASTLGLVNTNTTFFTVTGEVEIYRIVPFCTTSLTESGGAASISLGVTSSTALFIASSLVADIDANEFWVSTTPTANGIALPAAVKEVVITDNILTAHINNTTSGGVLRIDTYWRPLSDDGNVVAA